MWKPFMRVILFLQSSFRRGDEISLTQYYFDHLLGYSRNKKGLFSPHMRLIQSKEFMQERQNLKRLRYKLELKQNLAEIFSESK